MLVTKGLYMKRRTQVDFEPSARKESLFQTPEKPASYTGKPPLAVAWECMLFGILSVVLARPSMKHPYFMGTRTFEEELNPDLVKPYWLWIIEHHSDLPLAWQAGVQK